MARKSKIDSRVNLVVEAKYKGLEGLNQKLKEVEKRLKAYQPLLRVSGAAVLAFGAAAYKAAQQSMALASAIKDAADRAGMGTTELQVLGRIAEQSGSSMEEMGRATLRLAKSAQEAAQGNSQLALRFQRLGIDVKKFKDLSPERQMERLGLAVAGATERQSALAEVMALVGQDAGPKLMESLKKLGVEGYDTLAKKADASGEILSGSAIESLDRAGQAFKDLGH